MANVAALETRPIPASPIINRLLFDSDIGVSPVPVGFVIEWLSFSMI
jgi:hypothetical protein